MIDMSLHHNLNILMSRFPDMTLCIIRPEMNISSAHIDAKIDRTVALNKFLELLPPLQQLLQGSTAHLCKDTYTSTLLLGMMHLVLIENAAVTKGSGAVKFSRALSVKPDIIRLGDIVRTDFCEYVEFLEVYVLELREEHQLPSKLQWSNKGFFIQLVMINSNTNQVSVKDFPVSFQQVQKLKSGISFVTQEFSVKDSLRKSTLLEISPIFNAVLDELLVEVREYIGFLYKLSETLPTLDMFTSLATVSMSYNYVKPEFLDTIAKDIVASDVITDQLCRLYIPIRPNMSGKSTYLRQVVLLSIMAQIGYDVPAQLVTFRIPDRIFSRVFKRDCIESNSSTFMVEMQESSFILSNFSPTSSIIIDKLGRGTSVEQDTSICWAICEKLHYSSYVFLATPFMRITCLVDLLSCVSNYHFIAKTVSEQVEFTHQLTQGKPPPNATNYCMDLSSLTSLPSTLVDRARDIFKKIPQGDVDLAKTITKINKIKNVFEDTREFGQAFSR